MAFFIFSARGKIALIVGERDAAEREREGDGEEHGAA
jgi:hypothetical protein